MPLDVVRTLLSRPACTTPSSASVHRMPSAEHPDSQIPTKRDENVQTSAALIVSSLSGTPPLQGNTKNIMSMQSLSFPDETALACTTLHGHEYIKYRGKSDPWRGEVCGMQWH